MNENSRFKIACVLYLKAGLQTISVRRRPDIFIVIVRTYINNIVIVRRQQNVTTQPIPTDKELWDAFKHTRCANDVCWSLDDDAYSQIIWCINSRLINYDFRWLKKKKIQKTEVWGAWWLSNSTGVWNIPRSIRRFEVVMHQSRKMCFCSIIHKHILAPSCRYYLNQNREVVL